MGWGCFQASTYWQSLPLVLACHRDQASLIINRSTAASVIDLQVIERGILVGVIMTLASGQKHRVLWWFDQLNPIQRQRLFLLNRVFTRD